MNRDLNLSESSDTGLTQDGSDKPLQSAEAAPLSGLRMAARTRALLSPWIQRQLDRLPAEEARLPLVNRRSPLIHKRPFEAPIGRRLQPVEIAAEGDGSALSINASAKSELIDRFNLSVLQRHTAGALIEFKYRHQIGDESAPQPSAAPPQPPEQEPAVHFGADNPYLQGLQPTGAETGFPQSLPFQHVSSMPGSGPSHDAVEGPVDLPHAAKEPTVSELQRWADEGSTPSSSPPPRTIADIQDAIRRTAEARQAFAAGEDPPASPSSAEWKDADESSTHREAQPDESPAGFSSRAAQTRVESANPGSTVSTSPAHEEQLQNRNVSPQARDGDSGIRRTVYSQTEEASPTHKAHPNPVDEVSTSQDENSIQRSTDSSPQPVSKDVRRSKAESVAEQLAARIRQAHQERNAEGAPAHSAAEDSAPPSEAPSETEDGASMPSIADALTRRLRGREEATATEASTTPESQTVTEDAPGAPPRDASGPTMSISESLTARLQRAQSETPSTADDASVSPAKMAESDVAVDMAAASQAPEFSVAEELTRRLQRAKTSQRFASEGAETERAEGQDAQVDAAPSAAEIEMQPPSEFSIAASLTERLRQAKAGPAPDSSIAEQLEDAHGPSSAAGVESTHPNPEELQSDWSIAEQLSTRIRRAKEKLSNAPSTEGGTSQASVERKVSVQETGTQQNTFTLGATSDLQQPAVQRQRSSDAPLGAHTRKVDGGYNSETPPHATRSTGTSPSHDVNRKSGEGERPHPDRPVESRSEQLPPQVRRRIAYSRTEIVSTDGEGEKVVQSWERSRRERSTESSNQPKSNAQNRPAEKSDPSPPARVEPRAATRYSADRDTAAEQPADQTSQTAASNREPGPHKRANADADGGLDDESAPASWPVAVEPVEVENVRRQRIAPDVESSDVQRQLSVADGAQEESSSTFSPSAAADVHEEIRDDLVFSPEPIPQGGFSPEKVQRGDATNESVNYLDGSNAQDQGELPDTKDEAQIEPVVPDRERADEIPEAVRAPFTAAPDASVVQLHPVPGIHSEENVDTGNQISDEVVATENTQPFSITAGRDARTDAESLADNQHQTATSAPAETPSATSAGDRASVQQAHRAEPQKETGAKPETAANTQINRDSAGEGSLAESSDRWAPLQRTTAGPNQPHTGTESAEAATSQWVTPQVTQTQFTSDKRPGPAGAQPSSTAAGSDQSAKQGEAASQSDASLRLQTFGSKPGVAHSDTGAPQTTPEPPALADGEEKPVRRQEIATAEVLQEPSNVTRKASEPAANGKTDPVSEKPRSAPTTASAEAASDGQVRARRANAATSDSIQRKANPSPAPRNETESGARSTARPEGASAKETATKSAHRLAVRATQNAADRDGVDETSVESAALSGFGPTLGQPSEAAVDAAEGEKKGSRGDIPSESLGEGEQPLPSQEESTRQAEPVFGPAQNVDSVETPSVVPQNEVKTLTRQPPLERESVRRWVSATSDGGDAGLATDKTAGETHGSPADEGAVAARQTDSAPNTARSAADRVNRERSAGGEPQPRSVLGETLREEGTSGKPAHDLAKAPSSASTSTPSASAQGESFSTSVADLPSDAGEVPSSGTAGTERPESIQRETSRLRHADERSTARTSDPEPARFALESKTKTRKVSAEAQSSNAEPGSENVSQRLPVQVIADIKRLRNQHDSPNAEFEAQAETASRDEASEPDVPEPLQHKANTLRDLHGAKRSKSTKTSQSPSAADQTRAGQSRATKAAAQETVQRKGVAASEAAAQEQNNARDRSEQLRPEIVAEIKRLRASQHATDLFRSAERPQSAQKLTRLRSGRISAGNVRVQRKKRTSRNVPTALPLDRNRKPAALQQTVARKAALKRAQLEQTAPAENGHRSQSAPTQKRTSALAPKGEHRIQRSFASKDAAIQREEAADGCSGGDSGHGDENVEPLDLDALARQIYPHLKRLLSIERERIAV